MVVDDSTYKKIVSDPLTESIDLIEALAHVIQDCPVCLAKLKRSKVNISGATNPGNSNATIAIPQNGDEFGGYSLGVALG